MKTFLPKFSLNRKSNQKKKKPTVRKTFEGIYLVCAFFIFLKLRLRNRYTKKNETSETADKTYCPQLIVINVQHTYTHLYKLMEAPVKIKPRKKRKAVRKKHDPR